MKINIPIPVSLHRQRKQITTGFYIFITCIFIFFLLDPGSVASRLLVGKTVKVADTKQSENQKISEDSFYNFVGSEFQNFEAAPKPTPERTVHLPWTPKMYQCDDVFEASGHNFSYSDFYWEHADAYKGALKAIDILREANVDEVSWILHEISMMPFVETVCETGFRAGHFSFHWLTGKPEVVVHTFEANKFNFTDDMVTFMTAEFPDRFFFYPGKTTETIKKFHSKNNDTLCDIIFLDPTMKTEDDLIKELDMFKNMYQPSGHMVIMLSHKNKDAVNVRNIWKTKVSKGEIAEQFVCQFKRAANSSFEDFNSRNDRISDSVYIGSFLGK